MPLPVTTERSILTRRHVADKLKSKAMPEQIKAIRVQAKLFIIAAFLSLMPAAAGQPYLTPAEFAGQLGLGYRLESTTGRLVLLQRDEPIVVLAPRMARALVADQLRDLPEPGLNSYGGRLGIPPSVAETISQMLPKYHEPEPGQWKVLLDPGHGGKDPGAMGSRGTKEKNVNLDIAIRLRDALSRNGIEVVMTRETDVFIPLEQRTQICRRESPDAFISIHANAADSPSATGIETFYITQEIDDAVRARTAWLPPEGTERFLGTRTVSSGETREFLYTVLYEQLRRESRRLAHYIQDALLDSLTLSTDRGVKEDNFHVLRGAICPAALVETGFLSNPSTEKLLSSPYDRKKVADAIAAGIVQYFAQKQPPSPRRL